MLSLCNITKKYKKKTALDNFSAELDYGIYGLIGPNGAGKTTLINIIAGVLKESSGVIKLHGKTKAELRSDYYSHIGFMPQYPRFYGNFTGYEIMKYIASLNNVNDEKRLHELMSFVNLSDSEKKKVSAYSGGMKQRLAVAAALVKNPDVIILDEPTAGLDPRERIRFKNIISEIAENKAIIIATHIVSDVECLADEILLINEGKLCDKGTPSEICAGISHLTWKIETNSKEEFLKYNSSLSVSSIREDDRYIINCISKSKPCENAVRRNATLDDVFLYRFSEKENI